MLETLTVEDGRKVALPAAVQAGCGCVPQTPVRLLETQRDVLLIPLTAEH